MRPTLWDCHAVQTGGALSSFQRRVLDDHYSGGKNAFREGQPTRPPNPANRGPGLILVSILVMLPLVMSVYTALHGVD